MGVSFSSEDEEWAKKNIPSWKSAVKRGMDLGISLAALAFLSPLIILIAALIKITSKGPVFYRQERVGHKGTLFFVCKFRTMVALADRLGGIETHEKDPRITFIGRFLRRWVLDEIPQFWNVLKGEMSLVGPRPTLAYQVETYSNRQKRRLLVKPGMSGLAQVNGRNRLKWPERIEWDLRYIERFSLWGDFLILLKTPLLLLSNEGIYGESGF